MPSAANQSAKVSIHAPRAEGDDGGVAAVAVGDGFNPRPPRGGRPAGSRSRGRPVRFQSTPPARRATRDVEPPRADRRVSIHAPRAEGDWP